MKPGGRWPYGKDRRRRTVLRAWGGPVLHPVAVMITFYQFVARTRLQDHAGAARNRGPLADLQVAITNERCSQQVCPKPQ